MKPNTLLSLALSLGLIVGLRAEEMKKSAYLGVVTSPVQGALAAQLDLVKGSGLVVDYVDPESPAAKALEQHDVLVQLNEQILVSPQQLAVLVRNFKPGEDIALEIRHAGKAETKEITLGEKELPDVAEMNWGNVDMKQPGFKMQINPHVQGGDFRKSIEDALKQAGIDGQGAGAAIDAEAIQEQVREQMEKIQQQLQEGQHGSHFFFGIPGGGQGQIEIEPGVNSSISSSVVVIDGEESVTMTDSNGERHLTVKRQDGEVVFDGPVNTKEEQASVPEKYRSYLKGGVKKLKGKSKARAL